MIGLVPLGGELVRGRHDQAPVFEGYGFSRLEPGTDDLVRKLMVGLIEDPLPDLFG